LTGIIRLAYSLQEIYSKYKNDVEFMVIYIKEAHPIETWWPGETRIMKMAEKFARARSVSDMHEPGTIEERRQVAMRCKKRILGDLPVYLDTMDNKMNALYVAFPTRLCLIGRDGRVAWTMAPGPFTLNPDDFERGIAAYLTKEAE